MKIEHKNVKNSGIEWIGEIPNDWNKIYGQYLYDIVTGKKDVNQGDLDGQYPFFTCSDDVKRINEYSFDCEALLVAGNGIVGNTKYYNGKFDAYQRTYVLYNFKKERINIEFLKIYLSNLLTISVETKTSGSVIEFIKLGDIKKFEIVYPDINRQERIAELLNKKIHNINSLIMNEEQQIEKLREYKQSLITEVVTKGLNKNIEMKDSGVEWIGKIPKHWEIIKLKFVAKSIIKGKGITKDEVKEDGDIYCVRYGEIYSKYNYSFEKCISKTTEDLIEPKEYFTTGDILCAGTGELLEEIGKNIVYLGKDKCLAGGDIIIVKHNQESRFLNYALNSDYSQTQKSAGKMKLKVVHISATDIGNIILAIPPINEQKKIADYLDEQNCNIDKIKELKLRKINKLSEYKKSLIYEYVTGKKEV